MKKVLYVSVALLAAGMFTANANAAPASTSAVKLTVGGYMNAWMGYANIDKKKNGNVGANQFDIGTDGLISFNADAKLSNNLKLGAVAELVIATPVKDQEWLKDVYGYADTKFGKVEFGATSNAAKKMHHGAPDVGVFGVDESKLVNWLGVTPHISLDSTAINFDGNNKKLSYFSPKFYGFQIGLTYVPGAEYHTAYSEASGALRNNVQKNGGEVDVDVNLINQSVNMHRLNGMSFTNAGIATLAYNNKFGDVEVGADFGFGNSKPKASDLNVFIEPGHIQVLSATNTAMKAKQQYSFGADVAFSGFKIGAGYTWMTAAQSDQIKDNSDKAFEVGASYETGPFGISANYFYSKNGGMKFRKDFTSPVHSHTAGQKIQNTNAKFQVFQLSGKYKLGAGIDAFATFGYLKFDDNPHKANSERLSNVWTIATGLALKF